MIGFGDTVPVTVTVLDTDAVPQEGLLVDVFDRAAYTGCNDISDVNREEESDRI